jgi:RNA 2',3'-cyclic 3'-phosphodiesterase
MRLFVGVELDEHVKTAAASVVERLRSFSQRTVPKLDVRWIPPANLHITLWFIGEVADARADAIAGALKRSPMSTLPFDLALAGCGAFPPSGPPRIFWIGVRQGGVEMASLYREIGNRLAPLGFLPERRDYTAHLTIARVRDADRRASKVLRETLAELPADCGSCPVDAVTLFRSRLSPRGATYEPLLRVPLS